MKDENASRSKEPVIILTTPRLILRTTTENDIPILQQRIFGDSEVMRHVFLGAPMPNERSESFIRRFFTFGESLTGMSVLAVRTTRDVIGFAGLFPCEPLGVADLEIGFVLARQAWGRGIATEIGEAQLAFGFEELGCERLLGMVHPQNAPSIHALTKLGMRYLKDVTESNRPNRSVYVIGSKEWNSRRPGEQRV